MQWYQQKRPIYRQKKFIIPVGIILVLIAFRLVLPPVMLTVMNNQLKDLSPTIEAHVEDLDLSILRGDIMLSSVSASIKRSGKHFFMLDSVDASMNVRDLLRGDLVADVVVDQADFTYSDELMEAVERHVELTPVDPRPRKEIIEDIPVRVGRLDLNNSTMRLEGYPALTEEQGVLLRDISGRITNLLPTEELPKTLMQMQGKLLGSGEVKTIGEAKLLEEPLRWSVDSEILKLDLTELNQFLLDRVPLTFTQGRLDFYSEAKSEDGTVTGYLKPFVKDLEVTGGEKDFQGPLHYIIEVITALGNLALRTDGVTATRVPFVFEDGELQAETGEAIGVAFQHAFQQEITRGIENSINLN
jgi:hypothetical protein